MLRNQERSAIEITFQILDYVYRDYILSWYKRISDETEFHYDVRMTIQRIVIAMSER